MVIAKLHPVKITMLIYADSQCLRIFFTITIYCRCKKKKCLAARKRKRRDDEKKSQPRN